MKYILELNFIDKPKCSNCMLSRNKGLDLNGETIIGCSAIGSMPQRLSFERSKIKVGGL